MSVEEFRVTLPGWVVAALPEGSPHEVAAAVTRAFVTGERRRVAGGYSYAASLNRPQAECLLSLLRLIGPQTRTSSYALTLRRLTATVEDALRVMPPLTDAARALLRRVGERGMPVRTARSALYPSQVALLRRLVDLGYLRLDPDGGEGTFRLTRAPLIREVADETGGGAP